GASCGGAGENNARWGSTVRRAGKSNWKEPDTGSSSVLSKVNVTLRRSRAETLTTAGAVFTVIGTSGRYSCERFSSTVGGGLPRRTNPSLVVALIASPFNVTGPLASGRLNPVQPPRKVTDPSFLIRAYP